jgi:hypothetical protein
VQNTWHMRAILHEGSQTIEVVVWPSTAVLSWRGNRTSVEVHRAPPSRPVGESKHSSPEDPPASKAYDTANRSKAIDAMSLNPLMALRRALADQHRSTQLLYEMRDGIANLAKDLNSHLARSSELQAGHVGRAEQLLPDIRSGIANTAEVLNRHLSHAIALQTDHNDKSEQLLLEIRSGIANMAEDLNRHLSRANELQADQSVRSEQLLLEIRDGLAALQARPQGD